MEAGAGTVAAAPQPSGADRAAGAGRRGAHRRRRWRRGPCSPGPFARPRTSSASASGWRGRRPGRRARESAPAIDTLVDQTGRRFSLASLRGHPVAMVFFDSHCNQECPLEGRELAAAETSLPAAQRPVLVAVSVNPLDTPASARKAARAWRLAAVAPWHWLMGTRARLAPIWHAYNIYVGRSKDGDIPHTEALYPDRPPRLRALGLSVSVRPAVRHPRPRRARRRGPGRVIV